MDSLISRAIPYGVFVGQLHRGHGISTDVGDFLDFAVEAAHALIMNGCQKSRMVKLFGTFIRNHVRKYQGSSTLTLIRQFRSRVGNF
jgi:hypothetical protein